MIMSLPSALTQRFANIVQKNAAAIQYGPIGIDFGPNGLRMVQFKKQGDELEIHASVFIPIDNELRNSSSQLRTLIKRALKENHFVGREIVTCVQPENVKILMLTFMRQSDKKDEEMIVQRVAERVDDKIENYVIDYMMVRPAVESGQERSVLVALANHNEVIDYLEHLRKAGMKVKLLEVEPTAIRRLISVKHGDKHDANLMTISMGVSQTYITVLSGRRLIYQRDIDFGERQLIELLCKELEIDEHEARTMLVRRDATDGVDSDQNESVTVALYGVLKPLFMELVEDINRALIYAASETRGLPVNHVFLTNRVATWYGIESFINTLIEVPVSVLMPFDGFKNAEIFNTDSGPRGAAVTGMALFGLTEFG